MYIYIGLVITAGISFYAGRVYERTLWEMKMLKDFSDGFENY